jgi:hypothetical protein
VPLRRERQARGDRPDTMDIPMAVPYILVPSNDLHGIVREAEAAERRRVEEKVDTWREQINSAYHVNCNTPSSLRCCAV